MVEPSRPVYIVAGGFIAQMFLVEVAGHRTIESAPRSNDMS